MRAVSDLGSLVAGGFAVGSAFVAAQASRGRQRRAWAALTVAVFGWFFGDTVWAIDELILGGAHRTVSLGGRRRLSALPRRRLHSADLFTDRQRRAVPDPLGARRSDRRSIAVHHLLGQRSGHDLPR